MQKISGVKQKFPSWPADRQLQGEFRKATLSFRMGLNTKQCIYPVHATGAVAAYNFGVKNVQSWDGLDRGTTGNDYSNDVMARAQYLVRHFNWTC